MPRHTEQHEAKDAGRGGVLGGAGRGAAIVGQVPAAGPRTYRRRPLGGWSSRPATSSRAFRTALPGPASCLPTPASRARQLSAGHDEEKGDQRRLSRYRARRSTLASWVPDIASQAASW
eukprot:2474722-Rhodomonas_salina.1